MSLFPSIFGESFVSSNLICTLLNLYLQFSAELVYGFIHHAGDTSLNDIAILEFIAIRPYLHSEKQTSMNDSMWLTLPT